MAAVLGLLVALTYGSGDFFGGLAAKRTPALSVVLGSFSLATVLLALVTAGWAVVGHLPTPAGRDLALGVGSGIVGPVAVGFLYRGLASGRMSVVAPITAVVAAVVPFGWGCARGERPSAVAIAGVVLALVAVGLISGAPGPDEHPGAPTANTAEVAFGAVVAGIGFGIVFVLLGSTTDHAGLWPLLAGRMVGVAVIASGLTIVRRLARPSVGSPAGLWPGRPAWRYVAVSGVFDVTANGMYLVAVHQGLLSIVAVLSSLYPASTVALARVILHERFHRMQIVGLVVAALGVAAMTAG